MMSVFATDGDPSVSNRVAFRILDGKLTVIICYEDYLKSLVNSMSIFYFASEHWCYRRSMCRPKLITNCHL